MWTRKLFFAFLAVGILSIQLTAPASAAPTFTLQAFNIVGGGGSNDNDLNSATETLGIWNAIDGGQGTGALSIGPKNYNIENIHNTTVTSFEYNHNTFSTNTAFNTIGAGMGGEDFSVRGLATVTFQPGVYSVAVGSDDGRYLRLAGIEFDSFGGQNGSTLYRDDTVMYDGTTGHNYTIGTFHVDTPTVATLDTYFFERGGGDSFDLAIRSGYDGSMGGTGDGWELLANGALGGKVSVDNAYTLPAQLADPPSTPEPILLSHYAFNGNTDDGGLLNNTAGTLVGGAGFASGKLGGALSLDGNGDYFDTNEDSNYDLQNQSISVSSWVKLDADGWNDTWEAIWAKGEGSTYRLARSNTSTTDISYGNNFNNQTADLTDEEWHHILITNNSDGTTEFFFDGVSLGTGSGTIGDNRGSDLWIGANSQAGGREFGGMIDDFGLYLGDIGPEWAKAIYDLAVDPEYAYDVGQVNELGLLHLAGDGIIQVGGDYWEYAEFDPLDGNTFIQFGANGSGVHLTAIPEPATLAIWSILGLCFAGVTLRRRKH